MGFQIVFKTDVDVASDTLAATGAKETGQIRYENGNQYTLFKAGGTITQYAAIVISAYASGVISATVSGDNGDAVGIAQSAATSGQFFWAQTMGLARGISVQAMGASLVEVGAEASGKIDDGSTGKKFALLLETASGADEEIDIWIY